ncbi:molybdate ABC transporter substrate-binding protein [Myxosarcina sp. GI1(2024)]
MNKKRIFSLFAWAWMTFLVVIGCNLVAASAPFVTLLSQSQPVQLTISAAASMQDAMKAVGQLYQEENPNTEIEYNFGSSGALAQQIEQGAPVDVYISANQKFMNELERKDLLLQGTREDLLKNQVVLIVPNNGNAPNISNFQDLTNQQIERFSIGEPESVPAGSYAKQVLTSMNLYDELQPKTVFAKDVRQVLTYVETGNVDAGIVYSTDAQITDRIRVVATAPDDTHEPIIYPVAAIKRTDNPEAAKEFVKFLSSDRATDIFREYGFQIVNR